MTRWPAIRSPVRTDPRRLERVLANLVANAVEHGGARDPGQVGRRGGAVAVEVTDQGPGHPAPSTCRTCSTGSTRPTRPAPAPGSGLGLAIARENARLLGGRAGRAQRGRAGHPVPAGAARCRPRRSATVTRRAGRPRRPGGGSGCSPAGCAPARTGTPRAGDRSRRRAPPAAAGTPRSGAWARRPPRRPTRPPPTVRSHRRAGRRTDATAPNRPPGRRRRRPPDARSP